MDKPGFVIAKVTNAGQTIYIRETFLPEAVFAELEKRIAEKYGAKGIKALYSGTKKFGYNYSLISKFKRYNETSLKDFSDFLYLFVRYVGATWSEKITYTVDFQKKKIDFEMEKFIVCRLNGTGYTLTEGNTAGFWAYLMNDLTVEGYQLSCQGKGDKLCKMIFAPIANLPLKKEYFGDTDYSNLGIDSSEQSLNQIQVTKYSRTSALDLINSKTVTYSKGFIEKNGQRFFNIGATFFYLLERELKKLDGGNNVLFEVAFDFGNRLITTENQQGVIEYLSAFGWGDTFVSKKDGKMTLIANFFPWTKFVNEVEFAFYRGFVSGMLSKASNSKIIFSKFDFTTVQGTMALTISE
jgi:hypothetical protein